MGCHGPLQELGACDAIRVLNESASPPELRVGLAARRGTGARMNGETLVPHNGSGASVPALRFNGYLSLAGISFVLAAAVAGTAAVLSPLDSLDFELARFDASIWLLGALGLAGLITRLRRGRPDPFEPCVWLTLSYLVTFVFAGFVLSREPHRWHPALDLQRLTDGAWIVALGLGAYWLGYLVSPLARSPHVIRVLAAADIRFATLRLELVPALYLVGLGTRLYMFQAGLYGYLNDRSAYFEALGALQLLSYLEGCTRYALVLAAIALFRGKQPRWLSVFFGGMLGTELFFGMMSGVKGLVFVNFLLLGMAFWYVKQKIPVTLVVVALATAFFVFPVNYGYRVARVEEEFNTRSFLNAAAVLADLASDFVSGEIGKDLPVDDILGANIKFALERVELLQNVSLAVALTPEPNEFLSGRYYFILPLLAVVPRAAWPEKPVLDSGRQFALQYWGVPESMVMQATAPTNIGDLYINFGAAAVAVGMLLLGVVGAGFYRLVAHRPGDGSIFLYAVGFLALTNYEGDFSMVVLNFTRHCLVGLLVAGVVFRRAHRLPGVIVKEQLAPPEATAVSTSGAGSGVGSGIGLDRLPRSR